MKIIDAADLRSYDEIATQLRIEKIVLLRNIFVGDNSSLLKLAKGLGTPFLPTGPFSPESVEDDVVYRVEPRSRSDDYLMSANRMHFGYHTDGFRCPQAPDVLLLLAVITPNAGGESMLIRIDDLAAFIADDDFSQLLQLRFRFPSGIERTILSRANDGQLKIAYNPYDIAGLALRDRQFLSQDDFTERFRAWPSVYRLQQAVTRCSAVIQVKLTPGDCLLIDNTSVLHGRQSFVGNRLLKRVWIRAKEAGETGGSSVCG